MLGLFLAHLIGQMPSPNLKNNLRSHKWCQVDIQRMLNGQPKTLEMVEPIIKNKVRGPQSYVPQEDPLIIRSIWAREE